jgi:DNA-binding SARP family transcriptional activator
MEFCLLGPLEVRENGRAIEIGAAKQRALLAVLLLNANRVVSSDRLIEALWGERPPGTATKALQVYVSQLRKAIGRDRIRTRSPGYELRVEPGELDLHRFEEHVAGGEFDQALARWNGSPLADFAYEPFAQAEIARLEELRMACIEERVEAELAAGRHAALVGELEALVSQHPLRENLRAQLMLALYRSGRQADALDAYQSGRKILADELGLEPGEGLKELQRRILAQDRTLALQPEDAPPAPPAVETSTAPPSRRVPLARAREARKTVTVLSCDLAAVASDLDPESLSRLTAWGFEHLQPVLEAHGATVERSLGGALSAVFGIPAVHEDDALRAARAAVEMRDRLEGAWDEVHAAWGSALELRVGIGTGEVLVASDGDRLFATGQPVQSAIRLQQEAAPGELLVDERTHRLLRDAADLERLADHARIVAVRPLAVETDHRLGSPMVGRARERRRLRDAFEQAVADRSCQLFTLIGAPGVGKSRLVREFVEDVSGEAVVARGRCLPYGEGITYWPILEAVRDVAGLDDSTSTSESLATLAALVEGEDDAERVAERVGEVVGLSERLSGAEETFWGVRTFFEAIARRRPLVLVFDDIHWGERTFLDLVDHLADWIRDAPVLLLCVARPELLEEEPHWAGGKLSATSLLLQPLTDGESHELVANLAVDLALDDAKQRRIVDAAGGNPLFVEEMVALVSEQHDDAAEIVPPTIQALLAARLDLLASDERSALEAAAVEGMVFHEASVAELVDVPTGDVHELFVKLVRRDLLRPDKPVFAAERAYRFRHLLIRDAAYDSIPKGTRAILHERHAGWLEGRAGDRTLELDEIVGYHYEQAYRYRAELGRIDEATRKLGTAAARRLGAAGRRALVRSDGPAGLNLISRSVALLPPDDPFRVELVPNVRVVQGLSDLSWADRVLTEAIEAATTSGDRGLAAHASVQRGFLRLFTDEGVSPDELFDVSDRAIPIFESLGDELGLARAWRLVSQAHYLDGRPGLCAEASERAWVHARGTSDAFERREIVEWLVIVLLLGPTPATAAQSRLEELLDETVGAVDIHAQVFAGLATAAAMRGDMKAARVSIEKSKRIMNDLHQWIWIVTFWWGFVHLWAGEPDVAEAETRPAYEALSKIGEKSHFSSVAHSLAAVAYAQGRYDEAETLTRECEEACRPNDIHSQIMWRAIRAKVLAQRGLYDEAERLGREALTLAERGDFLLAHAEAACDLGEVLELAARPAEAALAFGYAADLFDRKGVITAAADARGRMARLTG